MKKIHLYHVTRPFCAPSDAWVFAPDKGMAISYSQVTFGFCGETKAKKIKPVNGLFVTHDKTPPSTY